MFAILLDWFKSWRRSPYALNTDGLRRQIRNVAISLLLLILLHVTAMAVLEGLQPLDAFWLTATTITTVGYGDLSPSTTAGKVLTILLLYFAGIFMLARLASLNFEARMMRHNKMVTGHWRWQMRDHILIINTPRIGAEMVLERLLLEIRGDPQYETTPVQVLTSRFPDGLPQAVRDLGATHYTGSPHEIENLKAVNITQARHVLLLADDENDIRSDSLNFDILHRMRELYTGARILVEAVDDSSRARFKRYGAHTIIRPIRAYPEMTVRAMDAPGVETVLEDLLTHRGSLTRRYNLHIEGCTWEQIVSALMHEGYGTALAYVDAERRIIPNPPHDEVIHGRGLIMTVRREFMPTRAQVESVVHAQCPEVPKSA